MTRKHYERIANALRAGLAEAGQMDDIDDYVTARHMVENIANRLCVELKADNPRFSEERFMSWIYGDES